MASLISSIFAKISSVVAAALITLGLISAPAVPVIPAINSEVVVAPVVEKKVEVVVKEPAKEKASVVVKTTPAPVPTPKPSPAPAQTFQTPSGAIVDQFGNVIKTPNSAPVTTNVSTPQSSSFKFLSAGTTAGPSGVSVSWKANMPTWQEIFIDFYINGKFTGFYSGTGRVDEGVFTFNALPGSHYDLELVARQQNIILDRISTSFVSPNPSPFSPELTISSIAYTFYNNKFCLAIVTSDALATTSRAAISYGGTTFIDSQSPSICSVPPALQHRGAEFEFSVPEGSKIKFRFNIDDVFNRNLIKTSSEIVVSDLGPYQSVSYPLQLMQ